MMRRILAAGVAAAVSAALLIMDVGPLGAETPKNPNVSPVLRPPAGQTAVKFGDNVTLEGETQPGATLVEALIHQLDAGGNVIGHVYDATDQTRVEGGRIICDLNAEGQCFTLWQLEAEAQHLQYVVTVQVDGVTHTGGSDLVPVDLVRPNIDRFEMVGRTRIRVVFSEPVFIQLDNPLDWQVDSFPEDIVSGVSGSGAERILHLNLDAASSLDEDATPIVRYQPKTDPVIKTYRDRANWALGNNNRPSATSLDRVPPVRIPAIEEIGGKSAGAPIHSTDPAPTVTAGNLRPGHVAEIYLEADGVPGRSAGDPRMGEAAADDDGVAQVALVEQLDPDGEHRLRVAARDPAGNRTNGNSAIYVLDRVAPEAAFAAATDAHTIRMVFTEALVPEGGDPAEWTVSPAVPVTDVSGSGSERILTLGAPISPEAEATDVSHVPVDGYEDQAGNALAAFNLRAFNGVPPELSVTVPLTTIWTPDDVAPIHGRAVGADRVEVFQEGAAGTSGAQPLDTTDVGEDRSFETTIGLPEDGAYEFQVRGLRGTEQQVVGPFVDVPTIVRDTGAPSVQVLAPQDGALVAGGSTVEIRWGAEDPSFGPGAIRIERSLDGGDTWDLVAGAEANDGVFEWEAPTVNTAAAMILVHATDRAGNQNHSVSAPFTIDSVPPRFSATTLSQSEVKVRFSEPVVGPTSFEDWRIDGVFPQATTIDDQAEGGAIRALVLRTAAPAHQVGKNDRPLITYKPAVGTMTDRAGNPVPLDDPAGEFPPPVEDVPLPRLTVVASDGIAPQLLTLDQPPKFVNARRIAIQGTGEGDEGNRVWARRMYPRKGPYASDVNPDGTFGVRVGLFQNRKSVFKVRIEDPSGNISQTIPVVIREDSRRPRVTVTRPRGLRAGRATTIRWRSRERYKDHVKVVYQVRKRRGHKNVVIKPETRDDGRAYWKVPRSLRGKLIRIKVVSFDRAGNKGKDYGRWMRAR